MESPCYKCGKDVEEGVPFCPHCAAPQIRVVLAPRDPQPISTTQTAYSEASPRPGPEANLGIPSTVIRWPQGLTAAATAGMVAGLGMTLVGLFGLWMLGGGILSVYFYRRRTHGDLLRPGAAARLGALSGTLGFVLFSLVTVPTGFFRVMMAGPLHKLGQQSDPQVQALAQTWLNALNTPSGLAAWLIGLFVLMVAAAAIGGALGGMFFGRRPQT